MFWGSIKTLLSSVQTSDMRTTAVNRCVLQWCFHNRCAHFPVQAVKFCHQPCSVILPNCGQVGMCASSPIDLWKCWGHTGHAHKNWEMTGHLSCSFNYNVCTQPLCLSPHSSQKNMFFFTVKSWILRIWIHQYIYCHTTENVYVYTKHPFTSCV